MPLVVWLYDSFFIYDLTVGKKSRLLSLVRDEIRVRHYSRMTEKAYTYWIVRFIRYHDLQHPNTLGGVEVNQFLRYLAVNNHVAPSTQNQALNALNFYILMY